MTMIYGIINDLHYTKYILTTPPHIIALTGVYIVFSISGRKLPVDLNVDFELVCQCTSGLYELYSMWRIEL